jgi:hypothetical protein
MFEEEIGDAREQKRFRIPGSVFDVFGRLSFLIFLGFLMLLAFFAFLAVSLFLVLGLINFFYLISRLRRLNSLLFLLRGFIVCTPFIRKMI